MGGKQVEFKLQLKHLYLVILRTHYLPYDLETQFPHLSKLSCIKCDTVFKLQIAWKMGGTP